jgi:hypothetical protein
MWYFSVSPKPSLILACLRGSSISRRKLAGLHIKFKAHLDYIVRSCIKTNKNGKDKNLFWQYWGLNSVLYHMSHTTPALLTLVNFHMELYTFPRMASDYDPPIFPSHITGITEVNHHTELFCWDGVLATFLPALASNHDVCEFCLLNRRYYRYIIPHLAQLKPLYNMSALMVN